MIRMCRVRHSATLLTLGHRYRTPLCILQSPRIIAAACYILAQKVAEGPNSASLDDRVSLSAGSASLPTPPSQQPAPPNSSHRTLELFALTEWDVGCVAGKIFYHLKWIIHIQ